MAGALADAMAKQGIKTLGFIGYSDAYGEGWLNVMTAAAKAKGIEVVAVERYGRTDTSVTGQVLKLVAAKPDGILVAVSGTPVPLPQVALKSRCYKGIMFHTHGDAHHDVFLFLSVCPRFGKWCFRPL